MKQDKKKLLIVVGAGASLGFGMPRVATIDSLFDEWANESFSCVDEVGNLYTYLKRKLTEYVNGRRGNKHFAGSITNFESLLFLIQQLATLWNDRDPEFGSHRHRLSAFINLLPLPVIRTSQGDRTATGLDLHRMHSTLVDKLLDYVRKQCCAVATEKKDELRSLQSLFDCLEEKFQLSFINLNYDNIILLARPSLETGFDQNTGRFDRNRFYNNEWNFCYHLHGSVHFDMRSTEAELHEICWNSALGSIFQSNSSGRNGIETSEGVDHLNTNIIAGLDKTHQLLRSPFSLYYARLEEVTFKSDAILFLGYGFSDRHLNKAFPFIRNDKTKKRAVVVVDWAESGQDGLRWRRDEWTDGMFETVPYESLSMGRKRTNSNASRGEPVPATYFKSKNTFERSLDDRYPLAVWYNGLEGACRYRRAILRELLQQLIS